MPAYLDEAKRRIPIILSDLLETSVDTACEPEAPEWAAGPDYIVRTGDYQFALYVKSSGEIAQVSKAISQIKRLGLERVDDKTILVLVVPFMSQAGVGLCREMKVNWIDLAGNARIMESGLRIRSVGKPRTVPYAPRSVDSFSPKRSRIAHVLLRNPGDGFVQKQLAEMTDLSEGYTSQIITLYLDLGYITKASDGRIRLSEPRLMFSSWLESYKFSRHTIISGHVASRSGVELMDKTADRLKTQGISYAVTGLPAAWLLVPFAGFRLVTVYLKKIPSQEILDKLEFREGKRGMNLRLVIPRDEGVFIGEEEKSGIHHVDPIQTILDLKDHPERSKEAAEAVRERYMGDIWSIIGKRPKVINGRKI